MNLYRKLIKKRAIQSFLSMILVLSILSMEIPEVTVEAAEEEQIRFEEEITTDESNPITLERAMRKFCIQAGAMI